MNDMLPEEQDPQFEELITLLRQANLNPPLIDPTEHAQIVSQARDRLFPTDLKTPYIEPMVGTVGSKPQEHEDMQHRGKQLLRLVNLLAAVLVVAALIGSARLIFGTRAPFQKDSCGTAPSTRVQPVLTILATQASIGQTPELKLSGFTPNTCVKLIRDGRQLVQTTTGSSVVTVGQDGTALVEIFIDRSFQVGVHVIEAQDSTARVLARATFRVVGTNPTGSPKLALGFTSLEVNTGPHGTKSMYSLLLENVGGEGAITWSVENRVKPSWFKFTPSSGSFNTSAVITITIDPGTLPPDQYRSDLWFYARGSLPIPFHFTMYIAPQPAPILAASPLDLTFNATKGQSNPPPQVVLITNTGVGKLYWSVEPFGADAQPWLSAEPTRGVLSAGQTTQVTLSANARTLNLGAGSNTGTTIGFIQVDPNGNTVNGGFTSAIYLQLQIV